MADNEKKKSGTPRIALGDYKAARHSLARIIRLRFRKEIDSDLFRDLCYGLNILLSFDKFEKESALEKRIRDLENKPAGHIEFKVLTQAEYDALQGSPLPKSADTQYLGPADIDAMGIAINELPDEYNKKRLEELLAKSGYVKASAVKTDVENSPPNLPDSPAVAEKVLTNSSKPLDTIPAVIKHRQVFT